MKRPDENPVNPLRGLSMFSMEFASKGLSWADDICQKLENVSLDKIIGQNSTKYIDAFGDQFRKICEDFSDDWLSPLADSCDEKSISDGSSQDTTKIAQKSATCTNAELSNEQPFVSKSEDSTASLEEQSNLCELYDKPQYNKSNEPRDKLCNNDILFSFEGSQNFTPCENPELFSSQAARSLEKIPFIYQHDAYKEAEETRGEHSACATSSCLLARDDALVVETEANGEFEDVDLEDCWEDADYKELILISQQASKNVSYKKKLKKALTSRFRSLKGKDYRRIATWHGAATDVEPDTTAAGSAAASLSGRLSDVKCIPDKDSCESESEWELL